MAVFFFAPKRDRLRAEGDKMISRQIVDQVTEASTANIASIVGEYVSLRRKGASYMGCCPFHNEKTPSFSVNPAKGF